jgi:hypothetical protein
MSLGEGWVSAYHKVKLTMSFLCFEYSYELE